MDVYPHMMINDDLDVCYDACQPMLGPAGVIANVEVVIDHHVRVNVHVRP